jgi:hypothetical protein
MKCVECEREIESLPYKCKFCDKTFCIEHHLPENHNCVRLSKLKERNIKRLSEGREAIDFKRAKIIEPTKKELFERELERQRKKQKKGIVSKIKRLFGKA